MFAGRDSSGVRGIRLGAGDAVISLSVLRHVDASPDERAAYLRLASARRRNGEEEEAESVEVEADVAQITLPPERAEALEAAEQFLLTVTDGGFGKRSSAYEYRLTGRGGQGFANITLSPRTGTAVAGTFVVQPGDDVMLVTDAGRLIRLPADSLKVRGRTTMGVTLFRLDADERVTSVFPVVETAAAVEDGLGGEEGQDEGSDPDDGA